MAKKKTVELERILLGLFRKRNISISRIVVFGSYAKGIETEDSDIDLIVVSRDFRNKDIFERVALTRGIHRELVREVMRPFDIMYYSDEEWEKGDSLIINAAQKEGEVVYSA